VDGDRGGIARPGRLNPPDSPAGRVTVRPQVMPAGRFTFLDLEPSADDFLADALAGLARVPKALSPKYFYDAIGSALFDAICSLPEYYPTRVETALMRRHGAEMAALLGDATALIEFGSGVSRKTRILIEAAKPAVYVPIDISGATLRSAAETLARDYPAMDVLAVCADYSRPFALPAHPALAGRRRVVFFPGSTIGNFTPQEATGFLRGAAALAGPGGGLLIGVDLKKDKAILDAAYDDAQGLTAAFNVNLLARMNRELGADFDVRAFRHRAAYVPGRGRIEMHLESLREQRVTLAGRTFGFRAGETIHTENSCKYTVGEFRALAAHSGFQPGQVWVDEAELFSVHYCEVPAAPLG